MTRSVTGTDRGDGPIGYFVHHQGRGHAERAAAVANELAPKRGVTLFCARDDIFPPLHADVRMVEIPSLFEPAGNSAPAMADHPTPETLHCAPVGMGNDYAGDRRDHAMVRGRAARFIRNRRFGGTGRSWRGSRRSRMSRYCSMATAAMPPTCRPIAARSACSPHTRRSWSSPIGRAGCGTRRSTRRAQASTVPS